MNKKRFFYYSFLVTVVLIGTVSIGVPQAIAQRGGSDAADVPASDPADTPADKVFVPNKSGQSSGFILDVKLKNPLKVDTIEGAIKFFVNTLVKIAIPFIVIFFMWAGLKFILAQGNPEKIKEAKKMFWFTIVGTLLILGAWTITNAIIGTINSIVN